MSYLSYFPDGTVLEDVFSARPERYKGFKDYCQDVMRGESSELTANERELIAAIVSGTTGSIYCYSAHSKVAEAFGFSNEVVEELLSDIDSARVDDKLKPLLHFVRKLTLTPQKMSAEDVANVVAAGWTEKALEDAIAVCGLFNLANRMTLSYGLSSKWTGKRAQHIDDIVNKGYV
ncbi:MAG: peroxidase-related enzyme [Pseudomonadales bacterium]|nr:peroxidase-related enzyme [Pseudomonadales bacterium]